MQTKRKVLFGSKAKYTSFGRKGCSVGMYATGGFYYYVYGFAGLFSFEIMQRWGDMRI